MKLTILGSGTNLHPTRAAAGYVLQTDHLLLFDFGPRTLSNLLKSGIDRHCIQHIFFSHLHADHVSDFITFFFDAVMQSKFGTPRPDITLYGPPGTKRFFQTIVQTFPSFRSHGFRLTLREVSERHVVLGQTTIIPQTVAHAPRIRCVGYRIEYKGKAIAYSGDSQYCPNLIHLCRGVDVAVLDCSFPSTHPGRGHMHAGECGRVAQEATVGRLVLSHFYPLAENCDVRGQARQHFRGRIIRGRDLLTLEI